MAGISRTATNGAELAERGVRARLDCSAFDSTLLPGARTMLEAGISLVGVAQGKHELSWRLETRTDRPLAHRPLAVVEVPSP